RRPGGRERLALAAIATVVIGLLPILGLPWTSTLYPVAAFALLVLGLPWSLLAFAAVWAVAALTPVALGHREWAAYYGMGLTFGALPLALVVRLVRAAQELQAAREQLAREAI